MRLRDAQRLVPTCKLTKKTLSHILLHTFCFHFLRIHQNYFFRRGFESFRAQFLSGNVSGKQCFNLPVQLRFIRVNFRHVELWNNVLLRFRLSKVFIKQIGILCFWQ